MALSCALLVVAVAENWRSPVLRSPVYVHLNMRLSQCDYFQIRNISERRIREKLCFFICCQFDFFFCAMMCIERHVGMLHTVMFACFLFLYCIHNYSCARIYGESFI